MYVLVTVVFQWKILTKTEPLVDVLTVARGLPSMASVTWRSVLYFPARYVLGFGKYNGGSYPHIDSTDECRLLYVDPL